MNRVKKIFLLINTVKYLNILQMWYRFLKIIKRKLNLNKHRNLSFQRANSIQIPDVLLKLDLESKFLNRFAVEDVVDSNIFCFLNESRYVDLNSSWEKQEISQLWRYNLHYFEYIYPLANNYRSYDDNRYYEKFKEIIESWIKNNKYGSGDAWHPYTISLRIYNWISGYILFREKIEKDLDFNREYIDSLFLQYNFLLKNTEKDVLGNHYFENLKALCIGSIFFKCDRDFKYILNEILKQLDEQILEDGVHFELSPMYHKIIFEDLLKIAYLIKGKTGAIPERIISKLQAMLDFMYSMEISSGVTPLFNDSGDNVSKDMIELVRTAEKYFNIRPNIKNVFEKSGFYILRKNYIKIIVDSGKICPDYLPAHGHCDALSYELYKEGKPFIVNSGTYKYGEGAWRDYFRSTKAHNTLVVDNLEQSQYWSSFRIARRISKCAGGMYTEGELNYFRGKYKNYKGYEHNRVICFLDNSIIVVLDRITPPPFKKGKIDVKSYIHFIPDIKLNKQKYWNIEANNEQVANIHVFCDSKGCTVYENVGSGWYSPQFGAKYESTFLEINYTDMDVETLMGYAICFENIDSIYFQDNSLVINKKNTSISYEYKKII